MTRNIALVTSREALALDEDLSPLAAALQELGWRVETPCWDDDVAWRRFDLAVLRSTWDYVQRIDEFLAWVDRCARQTRLLNPPAVVRWNTDKHYLRDLARAGVPVVPTRFVEPGSDAARELDEFLVRQPGPLDAGEATGFDEFVVKPSIGAGSRDTARYPRAGSRQALAHLQRLLGAGRSVLLQPYLGRVDAQGETAVVYLGGRYSHAFRKGPLLRVGDELVAGLFAPEDIRAREPDDDERRVAAEAYGALRFDPPVYARIDLIRDADGAPVVLELELTEPSLYFAHAAGAAARFAAALHALVAPVEGSSPGVGTGSQAG